MSEFAEQALRAENLKLRERNNQLMLDNSCVIMGQRNVPFTGFTLLREANRQRSREWQVSEEFNAMFHAVATGGECGEALNVMKKLERQRIDAKGPTGTYPSTAQLQDLAQEMGDTIIYMDLWAERMGIDLWKAVTDSFNNKSTEMGFRTKIE